MNDILLAVKFAYRHTIRSGRPGFFDMLIQGVKVMEVAPQDLVLYASLVVIVFVTLLTYVGELVRVS